MVFKRDIDPKKSMGIGAEKLAILVNAIVYYNHEDQKRICKKKLVHIFLQELQDLTILKNILFGPQRILLESVKIEDCVDYNHLLSGAAKKDPPDTKEVPDLIGICEFAGKLVKHDGEFYKMPTLGQLKSNGYEYFEEFENEAKEERAKESMECKTQSILRKQESLYQRDIFYNL